MTKQQTPKTKKIKIIIAIILSIVTIIGGTFISLTIIKTSYIMKINAPDKIIIYYNSGVNNIVFESNDNEYHTICEMINDSHKQSILTSIFNGQIFKDVNINEHDPKSITFEGIKVCFVYNTPQIAKLKKQLYPSNIWYKSLMFDISNEDAFNYHRTAIISPETYNDVSGFSYNAHYTTYSNFSDLYNYLNAICN